MYKSIVITLSVVSIDCSVIILSYRFGLAVQSGVSGPQGANSAPSLQWQAETSLSVGTEVFVSEEIGLPPQPVM